MKEIKSYINFNGNCREAMEFYARVLGADLRVLSYADAPMGACPPDLQDRLAHARLTIGDQILLMASDCPPNMEATTGNSYWLSLACDTAEELDRLIAALGENGKIAMPPGETFFAQRFGMVTDRYGVNWMFLYGEKKTPIQQEQAALQRS